MTRAEQVQALDLMIARSSNERIRRMYKNAKEDVEGKKKKHYRIRQFSPLWWITRCGAAAAILCGCYCWLILIAGIG